MNKNKDSNTNNKSNKNDKSNNSKNTSPIKLQMLNIMVVKLLDTFFNIKPEWCHSLQCASPVVFPFKWIRWVSFIYKR